MTRPPKPYLGTRRTNLATDLRALADELDRTDAEATQRGLAAALDDCYPSTASGANPGGSGGGGGDTVLTVVEAKASRRDPATGPAALILLRLRRIEHDTTEALNGLKGWRQDRTIHACSEGHPLQVGQTRCTKCGTRKDTERFCGNTKCGVKMLPGQPLRKTMLEGVGTSCCNKCWTYAWRHDGRAWGDALRLAPMVTELGTYHSEDPWVEDPATTS